jgi:hypothetical protein
MLTSPVGKLGQVVVLGLQDVIRDAQSRIARPHPEETDGPGRAECGNGDLTTPAMEQTYESDEKHQ